MSADRVEKRRNAISSENGVFCVSTFQRQRLNGVACSLLVLYRIGLNLVQSFTDVVHFLVRALSIFFFFVERMTFNEDGSHDERQKDKEKSDSCRHLVTLCIPRNHLFFFSCIVFFLLLVSSASLETSAVENGGSNFIPIVIKSDETKLNEDKTQSKPRTKTNSEK